MTTIYLIRHGQASAGSDNYDVLSPTGRTQAAVLGDYLKNTGISFDAVYSGTMNRQIDTATIATGIELDSLQQRAQFDEYDHKAIFERYLPRLAKIDRDVEAAATQPPNSLMSASVFTRLMGAWADDNDHTPEPTDNNLKPFESWNAFSSRILNGINEITTAHESKSKVAIFTSGGVISTVFHTMFQTTPQTTFEMNWGINNASLSSMRYREGKLNLREYNNISHLLLERDRDLITQI